MNGQSIAFEIVDDSGELDQAISAAVDLVGQEISTLAGSVSSGVAVQMAPFAEENQVLFTSGPAATDAVTGINDDTFRSGRQSYQDVAEAYVRYDLVPDGQRWRSPVNKAAVLEDGKSVLVDKRARTVITGVDVPTTLPWAPRGLLDQEPGRRRSPASSRVPGEGEPYQGSWPQ